MKKNAFTLAEVVITLGIIGVVSAITLPILINKINDIQYDRARQKALTSIGEAGRLIAIEGNMNSATGAQDFVDNYLSKKLSIAKTCTASNLNKCGFTNTIKTLGGDSEINIPKAFGHLNQANGTVKDIKWSPSYGFVMNNGYSVNLFYNPSCIPERQNIASNTSYNAGDYVCINAIYDMNGQRKPNTVGKDIGIVTILYPYETVKAVAPNIVKDAVSAGSSWYIATANCASKNYTLPDIEELISMTYNNYITDVHNSWSATTAKDNSNQAYRITNGSLVGLDKANKTAQAGARCVKR